jgi:AraC family transcriptional regulator
LKSSKATAYQQRFSRVLDYIDNNLDADLSVNALSKIACFSKYHFHRQFSQQTGISVFKYVQLLRLKRASYQLSFRDKYKVIDVALAAGFENAESFSRAFKKTFGQSPTAFKQDPCWSPWQTKFELLNAKKDVIMQAAKQSRNVNIVEFETTQVAALEHHGDPAKVLNSVKIFIQWRKLNKLSPKVSNTYNVIYGDPTTAPQNFQMDICASTDKPIFDNEQGVISKTIPGGRCAVLRHIGTDANIGASCEHLYGTWLPQSGEELRDFPCFFHRVTLFPDVNENEMITDIYLPLAVWDEEIEAAVVKLGVLVRNA